jgi:hypothetical protein
MTKHNPTIEQSLEIIEDFFVANQVSDPLTGMEIMVKHFKQLSELEQQALLTFMAYGSKKTVVNQ